MSRHAASRCLTVVGCVLFVSVVAYRFGTVEDLSPIEIATPPTPVPAHPLPCSDFPGGGTDTVVQPPLTSAEPTAVPDEPSAMTSSLPDVAGQAYVIRGTATYTINKANCLQNRSLGEGAFIASCKADFSNRVLRLFEPAPALRLQYMDYFEKVGENIARHRWNFLTNLNEDGNLTKQLSWKQGDLRSLASFLAPMMAEELSEHLEVLFGADDPQGELREWLEEGMFEGMFDAATPHNEQK